MPNPSCLKPYDTQGFVKILDRALKQGAIRPQNYAAITSTIDTFTNKDYYKISERMAQLALDITKDCKNDYEKAQAIVNYFATNGFTYDMDYIPPDESIDYFMFESKTGSCTSYATAMVLMARYVGVPARYVEGFAAFEKDTNDDSVFVVKDTNAHAFVECYIPAVGWMSFDPTVPEYMRVSSASGNAAGIISDVAKILGRIALFAGVLFVIVFIILLDRIEERVFRVRLHFKNSSEKPILVYQHITGHTCSNGNNWYSKIKHRHNKRIVGQMKDGNQHFPDILHNQAVKGENEENRFDEHRIHSCFSCFNQTLHLCKIQIDV